MDKCGICFKPVAQLFETSQNGVVACFKCQPLVPEVNLEDSASEVSIKIEDENPEATKEGDHHCFICNKYFERNGQLQAHLRHHSAERRFVCTYCNKAFSQSNNLRAHLRIHTNERPYKCTVCGKAFTQVTNLNNHVRLHTGERPFVCNEPGCNKAYAQVTNLNQHKKRHQNGRPLESSYDCTVCGEQFDQRNHMYSHRRAVHGRLKKVSLPFSCKVCDFACISEDMLMEHITEEQHQQTDGSDGSDSMLKCVFSSCEARFSCEKQHTDHLLKNHQLRVVTANPSLTPKRGRPPKDAKVEQIDTSEIEHSEGLLKNQLLRMTATTSGHPRRGRPPKQAKNEIVSQTIDFRTADLLEIDMRDPLYIPKLKVQNMFQ